MSKHSFRLAFAILTVASLSLVLLGAGGCRAVDRVRARLRSPAAPSPTAVRVEPTSTLAVRLATPAPAETATTTPSATLGQVSPISQTATPEATASPATTATPTASLPLPPTPATPVTSLPVRIAIPDLGIDVPVVEMGWKVVETAEGPRSEWDLEVIKDAAGHHIDSAPLGSAGNLVISGHNNIYGRVFLPISLAWGGTVTRLDEVTERSDALDGRLIYLYDAAGRQFVYRVTEFYRLKDTGVPLAQRVANARFMRPTADTRLTLVTCWPPWSNTHRLIVVARPAGQP